MQYKLHLNLRQIAALRIATSFWEKKEIKDKTAKFFESCNRLETLGVQMEWCTFIENIVYGWNKDVLPKQLAAELIHIIKMIGGKIIDWYQYIKYEYGTEEEAINCIDKIYWTPYGTVDVIKILKSSWLKNPHLDITKLYYFACSFALEDQINDLWDKIPKDKHNEYYIKSYQSFDRQILTYWKHRRDNDLPNLMGHFHLVEAIYHRQDMQEFNRMYDLVYNFNVIYDLNESVEKNMFRLSIHQGYFIVTTYFWEKLTKEERDESVVKCARIAVMRYYYYATKMEKIGNYKQSQYVEIVIFLMNQMTEGDKKSFFNEKIELDPSGPFDLDEIDVKDQILKILLFTWPWQELFITVLEDMLQYQDNDSQMVCMFLDKITKEMVDEHKWCYSLETSRYRSLLREAWLIIPGSIKQRIVREDSGVGFICDLIDVWDLDSFKLILNDPAIAAIRHQFIDYGLDSYEQFVVNDQFEKLDQLTEELFNVEEEKKYFKQKINPWYRLLIDQEFDLADKLLDWQSNTPEERQSLKNNIDHMDLCENFIQSYDFDLIDEFLDWKFETDEERKKCEDHFKTDAFAIKYVLYIWAWFKTEIEEAKSTSTKWLKWVLKSDEEIAHFKKEKLIDMKDKELAICRLSAMNRCGILNDFLSWCAFDDKEIWQIKQAIFEENYFQL